MCKMCQKKDCFYMSLSIYCSFTVHLKNDTVLLWDLKILYNFKVNFTSAMA